MNIFKSKQPKPLQSFYVIDDEEDIREILETQLLSMYQCTVSCFGCCQDALDALDKSAIAPNVILSDVRMPGMSGFSLSAAIKKRGLNIPVILITGLAGDEIDDGESIVISKPFNMIKIKKFIDRFL